MSILVDYSGIAISSIFAQKQSVSEDLIRHMVLNQLRMYNLKYRKEYGAMVIACDGGSWRKQIYPQYKAHRKANRDSSGLDWTEFFRILNLVRDEIADNFPYKVVRVDNIEADDIIGTLAERTQNFGMHEPVMIISADKDFIQLQQYSNVKQYSPMTKSFVKEKDPFKYLCEHIMRGDSGDGIPNVLSPDNTFIDKIRQKPISAKKIEQWIASYSNLDTVMDRETYRNFQRNQILIDLNRVPQDKKDLIINTFDSVKTNSTILNYLISNRCTQLIECAEEFNTL
jgi:5'-3' exonuclease